MAGLLVVLVVSPPQPSWSRSVITEILSRYATGDYTGAIKIIESVDALPIGGSLSPGTLSAPDEAFIEWQHAAKDWIRLDPKDSRRHQLIAATVALEIVHARSELNGPRRLSFVAWACEAVRDHPTRTDAERFWYRASIAVMQESVGFGLLPTKRDDMTFRLARQPADRSEVVAGHLTHALAAFPDDGRFRLAEVLARAALTSVTPFSTSRNRIDANEIPMKSPPTNRDLMKLITARLATLPEIERDLQALANDEQLRAEAELNVGYLFVRQQRWDEALAHLERVEPSTHDALLVCISHYLRGWVYQRRDRRDEAIAEYHAALEISPRARSVSIMLADELVRAGRQVEAYAVLDSGLKASAAPSDLRPRFPAPGGRGGPTPIFGVSSDPWDLFQHGDARLTLSYFTQLREALR
jgi:tetratricopeptide (TPR) repeat protein